jgi:hypothetical protein
MGRAKEQYMRKMEQGWSSAGSKWVCAKCFEDEAIQEFIREQASRKRCTYCSRFARNPIAAEMDDVIEFIAEGINSEYEDAGNGVDYETAEGGYRLATMDSWELLEEIGLEVENDALRKDLLHAFFSRPWVPKHPYCDRKCDALQYTWEAFSNLVKHRTRFVFFRVSTANRSYGESEPYEFLDALRSAVTETNLVRTIPAGLKWYRAHEHAAMDTLSGACRLGTPQPQFASHNRMSPAGIPMLYVAADEATSIAEVRPAAPNGNVFTVAEFLNLRPLRILNLSTVEAIPSLFDTERRYMRMALIFLRHFAEEISKPISDSTKPYDYVPTQVMTEYFRHLFHQPREINLPSFPLPLDDGSVPCPALPLSYMETNLQLDGIAFRSSKRVGGVNYTLFIEPEMCGDSPSEPGVVMLLTRTVTRP